MCANISLASVGMFDQQVALQRFPKDCVDLACDYIHRRFADLNFTDINGTYLPYGSLHPDMREKLSIEISRIGELMEHSRVPWKLFDKFEQTLGWSRSRDSTEELTKSFSNDLFQVVMHSDVCNLSWDRIIMAVVMTSTFVRHCADGNRSPECLKALFDGLLCLMTSCKHKAKSLHGWPCIFDHYKRMTMIEVNSDELFTGLVPKPRNTPVCPAPTPAVLPKFNQRTAGDTSILMPCPPYKEQSTRSEKPVVPQTSSLYPAPGNCVDFPSSTRQNRQCETGDNVLRRKKREQTPPKNPKAAKRHCSMERGESLSCSVSAADTTRTSQCAVSFSSQGRQMALQVMQEYSMIDLSSLAVVSEEEICSFAKDTEFLLKLMLNSQLFKTSMVTYVQQMGKLDDGCGPTAEFKAKTNDFILQFFRRVRKHGWETVAHLFHLLKNFVLQMKSDKCDLEMYKALADTVYLAFVSFETEIINDLGGWTQFRCHYERILRSVPKC